MNGIKELRPGTMFVWCAHLDYSKLPESPIWDAPQISDNIVFLKEVPEETGYHGECAKCGSKYFSRPDGAF